MGLETPPRRGLEHLGGMGIAFADLDPGVSLGWEHEPGNAPETGLEQVGGMEIALADLDPGVSRDWEHGPGNAPETGARASG